MSTHDPSPTPLRHDEARAVLTEFLEAMRQSGGGLRSMSWTDDEPVNSFELALSRPTPSGVKSLMISVGTDNGQPVLMFRTDGPGFGAGKGS